MLNLLLLTDMSTQIVNQHNYVHQHKRRDSADIVNQ